MRSTWVSNREESPLQTKPPTSPSKGSSPTGTRRVPLTDPVAAQKVRCRVRQFGGIFIFCVVVDRILIFVVWVRFSDFSGACSARFPKELDLLEPGNAKFCSPVQYCSPRLETRPQLSSTFGLSLPYRKFRKNFRESLIRANLGVTGDNDARPL